MKNRHVFIVFNSAMLCFARSCFVLLLAHHQPNMAQRLPLLPTQINSYKYDLYIETQIFNRVRARSPHLLTHSTFWITLHDILEGDKVRHAFMHTKFNYSKFNNYIKPRSIKVDASVFVCRCTVLNIGTFREIEPIQRLYAIHNQLESQAKNL